LEASRVASAATPADAFKVGGSVLKTLNPAEMSAKGDIFLDFVVASLVTPPISWELLFGALQPSILLRVTDTAADRKQSQMVTKE
jgi:hypothetical protein